MNSGFFDLRSDVHPLRWVLPVEQGICVGPPGNIFLFGGVGLGAALCALEAAFKRPVIWATAQFLTHVRLGAELVLDLQLKAEGKSICQAEVVARVGDAVVFTVNAALGMRPSPVSHQWSQPPEVGSPEACAPPDWWPRMQQPDSLSHRLEIRAPEDHRGQSPTDGRLSLDGRLLFWLRTRDRLPMDTSLLAIFADFIPSGVAAAVGGGLGGTSLDNTLRILRVVETEWVLCDIRIHGVHAGFAHGETRLFSESGDLMAISSQSVNVWLPQSTRV